MRSTELLQNLENLGLEKSEAAIYLAALKLRSSLLAPLAKAAEIPRSSAYSIIEHLIQKKFLIVEIKGKREYYLAAPPQQLLRRLLEQEQTVRTILPTLEALMPDELSIKLQKQTKLPFDS